MESPALCIDLGASFTKIAVRPDPNQSSELLRDYTLMTGRDDADNQVCFPSVVAHNIKSGRWAFSWDAANLLSSRDILILQDWKSVLFHERYLDESYDPELDGELDPVAIFLERKDPYYIAFGCAKNYIEWLFEKQIPHLLSQHPKLSHLKVSDFDTRVCVPDFVLGTAAADTIEEFLYEAGFETTDTYCVSEPKSSLVGILTEGRNQQVTNGAINRAAMFGDHKLLDQLKNSNDSIFFLDIGSFTTDMALANLNCYRTNHLAKSPANSIPLGIYKLDAVIQSQLPKDVAEKINLNNLPDTEKFHRTVYNVNRMNFDTSDTISLDSGAEVPLEIVEKCIDDFAAAIISACASFLYRNRNGEIHAAILTGGGSLPTRISDRIVKGLENMNFPLLRAHKDIESTMHVDPIDQELVRGASAIGGNSVLFVLANDFAVEEKASTAEVVQNLFGSL
ncbi:MAG: hypothetical protein P1V20_02305 [Verrucomicrobiales bacterium]|nr:hypothetical protein [Verrucomicrobiales bacterium]